MSNYCKIIVTALFILITCFVNIALADTFLNTVNEKVNKSKETNNEKDKKEHHDDDDHHNSSSSEGSDGFMSVLFRGIFFSSDIPHTDSQ